MLGKKKNSVNFLTSKFTKIRLNYYFVKIDFAEICTLTSTF